MEAVGFASIAAFLIMAVLRGIDRSLERASLDLGGSRWDTLIGITLPLAWPGIMTAGLIVFIKSLSDFGTPMFIGGNYNVLATQAYMTAVGSYDLPKAAAISTVLLIPALAVLYGVPQGHGEKHLPFLLQDRQRRRSGPSWESSKP